MTKSCFPVSDTLSAEASPADDVVSSLNNKKYCYRIVDPNQILYIEFGSGSRILDPDQVIHYLIFFKEASEEKNSQLGL